MKHILFDLEGCDADLLDDARHVRNTLFHSAILSNSRILKIEFHQFHPQGVTGFALLADSHISILIVSTMITKNHMHVVIF